MAGGASPLSERIKKMGFFSKLGNMATGGLGFTSSSSIGGILNNVTGATSSAALQQKYALQNAAVNHAYQKEFAQNAHQWEMQDLQKAGLNPALTATGGSGASASGGGSFGGGGGQAAMNPFDILNSIVGMRNQTSATKSQNNLNDANAMLAVAQAKNIPEQIKIQWYQALTERMGTKIEQANSKTREQEAFTNRYRAMTERRRAEYQNALDETNANRNKGGKISEYLGTWYWF